MTMSLLAGCGGGSDSADSDEPYEVSIQFVVFLKKTVM
jgi:hypothetical protein